MCWFNSQLDITLNQLGKNLNDVLSRSVGLIITSVGLSCLLIDVQRDNFGQHHSIGLGTLEYTRQEKSQKKVRKNAMQGHIYSLFPLTVDVKWLAA